MHNKRQKKVQVFKTEKNHPVMWSGQQLLQKFKFTDE